MNTIIETKDLKKYFQIGKNRIVHATDGLSVTVGENEIVGLVGESGSGKSTFGKTVVGLHDKTSGEVWYKGELTPAHFTPSDYKKYSTEMQMIFQDPYSSLNPRMNLLQLVGEPLYVNGFAQGQALEDQVAELLKVVGLRPAHMTRYPHAFSGGERQRHPFGPERGREDLRERADLVDEAVLVHAQRGRGGRHVGVVQQQLVGRVQQQRDLPSEPVTELGDRLRHPESARAERAGHPRAPAGRPAACSRESLRGWPGYCR